MSLVPKWVKPATIVGLRISLLMCEVTAENGAVPPSIREFAIIEADKLKEEIDRIEEMKD